MAAVQVVIAPAGDSSTSANALRVGFIAICRAAGLNRAQTLGAWKALQASASASDFAAAWDNVAAAIAAAPPQEDNTDGT